MHTVAVAVGSVVDVGPAVEVKTEVEVGPTV